MGNENHILWEEIVEHDPKTGLGVAHTAWPFISKIVNPRKREQTAEIRQAAAAGLTCNIYVDAGKGVDAYQVAGWTSYPRGRGPDRTIGVPKNPFTDNSKTTTDKHKRRAACILFDKFKMYFNHNPDADSIIVSVDTTRRHSCDGLVAVLALHFMYRQHECPRLLLWWSPPLSDVGMGILIICVGRPDLGYLMHGLDLGFDTKAVVSDTGQLLLVKDIDSE